ncbi:ImmA/IrrE family metallo-endopeptidase [Mycolicibacterium sp.]|uniref:ImmA/IrrE family metallo-endopeptidase n=1 Tax=Mycolicibacterium sp. TaxID=2320850 RepID=UPI0037CA6A64
MRKLLPHRTVSYSKALTIAELQATRLAAVCLFAAAIQEEHYLSLTPITVRPTKRSGTHSGRCRYECGRWIIELDRTESAERQRFTLAHEFKHIIDSTNLTAYRRLTDRQIERICDHFAACLLMSRPVIEHLWARGLRTPEAIAATCRVSLSVAVIRLRRMGLPIHSARHQLPWRQARYGLAIPPTPPHLPAPESNLSSTGVTL